MTKEKMTREEMRAEIESLLGFIGFEYNGKWCGVDPFSAQEIEMFCGDKEYTARSVEDAMTVRLFDGRSLDEIAEELTNIDL